MKWLAILCIFLLCLAACSQTVQQPIPKRCRDIPDQIAQDMCLIDLAIDLKNRDICKLVNDRPGKRVCAREVETLLLNEELKDNVGFQQHQDRIAEYKTCIPFTLHEKNFSKDSYFSFTIKNCQETTLQLNNISLSTKPIVFQQGQLVPPFIFYPNSFGAKVLDPGQERNFIMKLHNPTHATGGFNYKLNTTIANTTPMSENNFISALTIILEDNTIKQP